MSMWSKNSPVDCDWCGGKLRRHGPKCQKPYVWIDAELVDLRLNEYQVSNLRWLLEQTEDTHNTGDWFHELKHMLDEVSTGMEPNGQ